MQSERYDVYLASASPRRHDILRQIGVCFRTLDCSVPEITMPNEMPRRYVQRLAQQKAEAGLLLRKTDCPVIGADTIVVCDNAVFEKPQDLIDAQRMLGAMSGKMHSVLSAVCLTDGIRTETRLSETQVYFREISPAECEQYWRSGEPQGKAGSYAIQGLGAVFVARIEGSYSAVVGLPISETVELLSKFNVLWWNA